MGWSTTNCTFDAVLQHCVLQDCDVVGWVAALQLVFATMAPSQLRLQVFDHERGAVQQRVLGALLAHDAPRHFHDRDELERFHPPDSLPFAKIGIEFQGEFEVVYRLGVVPRQIVEFADVADDDRLPAQADVRQDRCSR